MKKLSYMISFAALLFNGAAAPAADLKIGAPIGDYVITAEMLNTSKDCQKDVTKLTDGEAAYQTVLCRVHKDFRERTTTVLDSNVETLQRLQKQGLSAAQQALAALMEGLSHCQRARLAMPSMNTNATAKVQFCSSRDSAAAALSSVPWRYARFGYQADTGKDVDLLVDEMTACYAENEGPLNSIWNSTCGLIEAPTPARQQQLAEQTYAAVESRYFAGSSPITAMFMEKKTLANKVLSGAATKVKALQDESMQLGAALNNARRSFYADIKDPNDPNSPLDRIVRKYKESYAVSRAILARYEEWQKSLLMDKRDTIEVDLSVELVGPSSSSPPLKDRLAERVRLSSVSGLNGEITELVHRLDVLQKNKAGYEKSARKMCAVYFCYLAVGEEADSLYRRACAGPALFSQQKNPLCESVRLPLKVGDLAQAPKDFCAGYDFDSARFGKVGMTFEQASACVIPK